MNRYGHEYYGGAGHGFRPRRGGMDYGREQQGRFHGGAAWGGFRRMNAEEIRGGVPERIARAAREGRIGYGGYPGPRRTEQWGRYDLGYRRGYDRGW
jgi:hypothetical protein